MSFKEELQWSLEAQDLCEEAVGALEEAEYALQHAGGIIYDEDVDRQINSAILSIKKLISTIEKNRDTLYVLDERYGGEK
ncbi:MAG: hypothetical protein QXP01_01225 [Candidatus Hadarchaeum sp.]